MTPAMRKAWHWLQADMGYKPPEQLGTAEEIALNAFSFGWAKGSADGSAEERAECASCVDTFADDIDPEVHQPVMALVRSIAKDIRARGKA